MQYPVLRSALPHGDHGIRWLSLKRMTRLESQRPVVRYERERPGELVHLDINRLGKIGRVGYRIHGNRQSRVHGIGWECTKVAIDHHSRPSYAEVYPEATEATTAGFLRPAAAGYATQGTYFTLHIAG